MSRAARLWLPPGLWAGVLLAASAQPAEAVPQGVPDWLMHGLAYLVLGGLVCRALAGGLRHSLGARRALAAVALCTCFGGFDEWTQRFSPGREPSGADVAKDAAGASAAALAWLSRRRG